jgi:hypothetical protein
LILQSTDIIYTKKEQVARDLFDGRCFVCQKPYGKGFAFHHKSYDPQRKTHKDFKNSTAYNNYVIPEIINCPDRFRLLCKICHARIDQPRLGYLGHMKKDKLIRLFIASFETIPKPRKNGGDSVAHPALNSLENKKELDAYVMDELNNLKSFLMGYAEK